MPERIVRAGIGDAPPKRRIPSGGELRIEGVRVERAEQIAGDLPFALDDESVVRLEDLVRDREDEAEQFGIVLAGTRVRPASPVFRQTLASAA